MKINKDKLIKTIESLYDDIGFYCDSSEVCIYEGTDSAGNPMQLTLAMTNDKDRLIEEPSKDYICVGKYKEDVE